MGRDIQSTVRKKLTIQNAILGKYVFWKSRGDKEFFRKTKSEGIHYGTSLQEMLEFFKLKQGTLISKSKREGDIVSHLLEWYFKNTKDNKC